MTPISAPISVWCLVGEEAHREDGPLARWEVGERRLQRQTIGSAGKRGVGVREVIGPAAPLPVRRGVQRQCAVPVAAGHRLQHVVHRDAEVRGQLLDGRGSPQVLRQLPGSPSDPGTQLLQPPARPDGPPGVAEVALDLTGDGDGGVGHERMPQVAVVALHRLDESQGSHLHQVLGGDATVPVAQSEPMRCR